jgi:flagellar hook assembly protein FlgD
MFGRRTHTIPEANTFDIELTRPSTVELEVFDQAGRRVWATRLEDTPEGPRTIFFEGRDHDGRPIPDGTYIPPLPDGTYIYTVSANGSTITRKITIVH